MQFKQGSLVFLIKDNGNVEQICLAMKKRGLGEGKWNGAGGKFDIEKDKTVEDCATRETFEEIGVKITGPEKVAVLEFIWEHTPEMNMRGHVYIVREWEGDIEPTESEEMRPEWYDIDKVPYDEMWETDQYWLPSVLDGKKIKGKFFFGESDVLQDNFEINIVDSL